jgi:hypothetical protein
VTSDKQKYYKVGWCWIDLEDVLRLYYKFLSIKWCTSSRSRNISGVVFSHIEIDIPTASTAIFEVGTVPLGGEIRQLAREIVDAFQNLCIVLYYLMLASVDGGEGLGDAICAEGRSVQPGLGHTGEWFGCWRVTDWSRECTVSSPVCPEVPQELRWLTITHLLTGERAGL